MHFKRIGLTLGVFLLGAQVAVADYEAGQKAFSQKDYSTAIEQWELAAHKGDGRAQMGLGVIFEEGADGFEIDFVRAYTWFKLADAQNIEGAIKALDRLQNEMTPGQIEEANGEAVAALGVWYRKYLNQDEEAFQKMKAEQAIEKQRQLTQQKEAAKVRADNQADLIAQRNADAKIAKQLEEENRKAAILVAQQQAEEAKLAAYQRQQQAEEQQRLAALKNQQEEQKKLDEARARLEELKAKQQGGVSEKTSTVVRAAPAVATVVAVSATNLPTSSGADMPGSPTNGTAAKTVAVLAPVAVAKNPTKAPAVQSVALSTPAPEKPGGSKVEMQEANETAKKIKIESETAQPEKVLVAKTPSVVPLELQNNPALNEEALIEIFEMAQSVPLDSPAAQAEISESLVRIDALKWSLISGVKGDTAAPKMNKVLMSKMTPVQIAEANRLAGAWLEKRQSRL
jgi:hypothetical protein